jgi:hypothetical protein
MPRISEINSIHIPVVAELRRWIKPGWLFFHCPNGEWRSPRAAAKLKAMGVLPGVPDLVLLPPTLLRAHFMEFKLPGKPLSESQENLRLWAVTHGYPYVVAYTQSEAFRAFSEWSCWDIKMEERHE